MSVPCLKSLFGSALLTKHKTFCSLAPHLDFPANLVASVTPPKFLALNLTSRVHFAPHPLAQCPHLLSGFAQISFCKASCYLQAHMPSSLMVCLMPAVRVVFKPCCDPSTVRGPSRFSVCVCWISEQWWKRHQEASANRNIIFQVNRLLWWCDDSYHTLSGTFKKEPWLWFLFRPEVEH